jgi:hypothetical protein
VDGIWNMEDGNEVGLWRDEEQQSGWERAV